MDQSVLGEDAPWFMMSPTAHGHADDGAQGADVGHGRYAGQSPPAGVGESGQPPAN
jgi:hypothetical protein